MNANTPTPSIEALHLPSDQKAVLKAFVRSLRETSSSADREQQRADAHRASAAAELAMDNIPIGEQPSPTAGMEGSAHQMTSFANEAKRAQMLIIAADPSAPQAIASAVAEELGRELHPVDLSQIMSKFIAQVEKHLEEVFDVAGEDGAILFFDDADALFGQRGDVAGSQFADQEVGYLLHHIEGYDGVSIMAVHAATAIQPDVQHRFSAVIRA